MKEARTRQPILFNGSGFSSLPFSSIKISSSALLSNLTLRSSIFTSWKTLEVSHPSNLIKYQRSGGKSVLEKERNPQMQGLGDFKLPHFFNYSPYFTLQPVRETRAKQVQLWKELILDYCRSQKVFIIGLEEEFPLFSNPVIERSLSHEARDVFLSALVTEGRAEWMDKSHKKCLILWLRIQDWADQIIKFVRENGLEDGVMTVEDIRSGIESRGTELAGIDRGVLMRALRILEQKGKAAIFKGTSTDDDGVKFCV